MSTPVELCAKLKLTSGESEVNMDKKNPDQKRNERPRDVEEEHTEKGGLKTEIKSQGLKSDATKLPEADPVDVEDEEESDG